MNRFRMGLVAGLLSWGLCIAPAQAHFLFIQNGPHAEAGRHAVHSSAISRTEKRIRPIPAAWQADMTSATF